MTTTKNEAASRFGVNRVTINRKTTKPHISFVRINEAARRLGCHRSTVYRKAAQGLLPRLHELWPDGPQGFVESEWEAHFEKQLAK